jgi:hypothetical protein
LAFSIAGRGAGFRIAASDPVGFEKTNDANNAAMIAVILADDIVVLLFLYFLSTANSPLSFL